MDKYSDKNKPIDYLKYSHPQNSEKHSIHHSDSETSHLGMRIISTQPICSQLGVGVYQGGVVTIQKWGFSAGSLRPTWMICTPQSDFPNQISIQLLQQLRSLVCLLAECYKQPSLWKNYLIMKGGAKLDICLQPLSLHEGDLYRPSTGNNSGQIETKEKQPTAQEPTTLEVCSQCSLWQFLHPKP